ncbi:helix-turn-helix transcriptional regulator [Candidatus Pelagibacter bacterium]|jgi:DNA-binding HxlR family transcriptional regulator|nr:helix-turn-helix transcriptional regulator [Candidatus Pelagibacter sp.]MDB2545067.1 helix-turn-helix transcriptional regulator [Candidatus Pelagibacter bacterium]MDB4065626.1 helix-turn-helix transcriptional regulator [Candidatus Pelagibacter sp.]MDC0926316.1 helix-turn-helix domain-containing protein [Candidatus Pelagibacter sp.]MDC1014224.1 helix-turn-helix domain-containing protein [Candidatus Pelagibacter sp.]|tara:strand:- start:46 stop:423 length:378 start_codon:yes stop_codon:yes gene_type:complete
MTGHFLLFDYKRDMEKINKKQSCPFSNVMKLLGGKWKIFIILRIYENKKIRFNMLKKTVTNISSQVLVRKLYEMRKDGLVVKIINKSQNVEYKLSEFGNSVIPIISALKKWSLGRKKEISKIVNI